MKFYLPIVLLVLLSFKSTQINIIEIRQLYDKAIYNETAALNLLAKLDNTTNNTLLGYKGVAKLLLAKHVFLPNKKMSYFKSGKAILQQAITTESNNTELIFLRFTVQCETPSFLKYNTEIITDKLFLLKHVNGLTDVDLKKRIKDYLLYSKQVTKQEKLSLQ